MPVQPPTRQQLEWIADALHMQLTEEELDVFEEIVGPSFEAFRRLDDLPDSSLPVSYPREDLGTPRDPQRAYELLGPGFQASELELSHFHHGRTGAMRPECRSPCYGRWPRRLKEIGNGPDRGATPRQGLASM